MNYSAYYPVDVVNGEGTRCTLFVSGCTHNCRGCYNKATWNTNYGEVFTKEIEDRVIEDLQSTRIPIQGISLSGGDPLHPANLTAIIKLIKRISTECPTKDVWLWSGYTLDNSLLYLQRQVLSYVDVFIDGKFIQELADPKLLWRGSSNQVIHRFTK